MKLKDFCKIVPPSELIYLGCASGFIFIGKNEELKKKLRKVNKELKQSAKNRVENSKYNLDCFPQRKEQYKKDLVVLTEYVNCPKGCCDKDLQDYNKKKKFVEDYDRLYVMAEEQLKKNQELLENFEPLAEREVKHVYCRKSDKYIGIAVIVQGKENGKYWTYKEFETGIIEYDKFN